MKVMLLNPSTFKSLWKESFRGIEPKYQPLGISYIVSYLKSKNKDVILIDADLYDYSEDEFKKLLTNEKPDLVGITSSTSTYKFAKRSAELIKEEYPKTIIVLGGPHASILPKEILEDCKQIDYVIIGEGEETLLELINSLENNLHIIDDIKGVAYKRKDKFFYSGPRKLIKDLDSLPFPERNKKEIDLYKPIIGNYKNLPVATMMSSRGCPFGCIFCDKSIFGRSFNMRSAKNVVDEMEYLYQNFGVQDFIFFDDLFTIKKQRVIEICNEIIKRGLKFNWACESRVDTIDEEMLKAMKVAGCWQISYGIESGNQDILNLMRKDTTLNKIRETISLTKKNGIKTRAYLIIGFPKDTETTINETIKFTKDLKLDNVLFSFFTPFPGTYSFEIANKYGKINVKDWSDYYNHGDEPSYIPKELTAENLKKLMIKAYKSFYLDPRFIIKHALEIRSWIEFKNAINGFFAVRHL